LLISIDIALLRFASFEAFFLAMRLSLFYAYEYDTGVLVEER